MPVMMSVGIGLARTQRGITVERPGGTRSADREPEGSSEANGRYVASRAGAECGHVPIWPALRAAYRAAVAVKLMTPPFITHRTRW